MANDKLPYALLLLLIDGLSVLRRCYEANPAPDSADKAEAVGNAAFSSFRRALAEHKPTHALAAFDYGGPTWRHEVYADYKKSRKPMPEPLRDILPGFKQRLRDELGLTCVTVPGVEADDTVNTVAVRWLEVKQAPVIVISTDKDLCVLLARGAQIRDHFKKEWVTADTIRSKRHGVGPELLADYLALMGDAVDDIPGVPGVGQKTAAKLLLQYGGLGAVLEAADAGMPGKIGDALRKHAPEALLSQKLVGLKSDVQVGLAWNDMRYPRF